MSSQSPQLVFLLIILLLLNPCSVAAQNSQTPTQSNNLRDYLESLLPAEVEGRVIDNGGNIEARFWIIDEDHPEVMARRIARDYMYAAYNSPISIRSAKIEIIQPTGEMGLSIILGANVASVYKDTHWIDPTADPSTFIRWVRNISAQQPKGLGLERASLKNAINMKGPWSELTPQNSVDNKPNIVHSPQSARVKGGEAGAEARGAEPARNPLAQPGGVYKTEESFKATPPTLQDRKPEIVTDPKQTAPLNVSSPAAAGALAGWIGKGLLSGIRSFVGVVGQTVGDGKKQTRAQEPAATKSAAHISAALREQTTASLDAHNSSVVLDEWGKLDHAVPVSRKEGSNLTSAEPEGGAVTEESPALSHSLRTTKNENSTAAARSPSNTTTSSSASPAPPKEVAMTDIYRIGVGDVLDIRLLNSATPRSTLYTVIAGGLIDFPIAAGPMAVAGLTVDEIQTRVASELKRRAVEEGGRVSVGVRHYASHSVVITGLVLNPGSRILRREAVPLYVIMAEAQARPDAGRVTVIRPGSAPSIVDLGDPAALDFIIRSGDTISVTARPEEFYFIGGGINDPGQKIFQPGMTLLQAILSAGGLKRQDQNLVEVSRQAANGFLTTSRFKLKEIKAGKKQDPRLHPGDRIEVAY